MVGVNQDITERKKTEEQLLVANFAMQSSISAICLADLEGRITYVNDSFLSLWGYDEAEEVIGRHISEFAMPGTEEEASMPHNRAWSHRRNSSQEEGRFFFLHPGRHECCENGEGELVCTMASFIDTTARKKMEDALRESEAKFRSYIESSPLAVIVAEPGGRIVDMNRTTIELLGYDAATLSRMHVWELHPAEDRRRTLRRFIAFNRDGHLETEFRFQRQDGSAVWVSLHATMIADGFSLAYCSDITSRKEAEEALRRYKLLSGSSRDIILFMGRGGDILEANVAAEKAYGYSREELLGFNIRDLCAPETAGLVDAQMTEADQQGILFETTHLRSDGSTFPVEVSSQAAAINETLTLISVVRDISERKLAEKVLKESEESLRVFMDAVPHPAFLMDRDGTAIVTNSALARSFGVSKDNLKGKKILELSGPGIGGAKESVCCTDCCRQGGRRSSKTAVQDGTSSTICTRSLTMPVQLSRIAVFALDITESEEPRGPAHPGPEDGGHRHPRRGVAHDFNNILTVIMGLGNLIQMSLGPDDRNRPYVDQIVALIREGCRPHPEPPCVQPQAADHSRASSCG